MADKENDNKFMSMLERMGMVRRIDSDDPLEEALADEMPAPPPRPPVEDNPSARDAAERQAGVIGGSRQAAPGMSEPVMPVRPAEPAQDHMRDAQSFQTPVQPAAETRSFERHPWEDQNEPSASRRPGLDAYTDRYLDVEELYESFSMKVSGTDTIYLIEEYLRTLPPSLPDESRREIIAKIISASGFNFESLIGDGMLRVSRLKEYAEQFARRTDDYLASRNDDLAVLERQMQNIQNMIEQRRELHKRQFFTIEAEAQRLRDILSFISD